MRSSVGRGWWVARRRQSVCPASVFILEHVPQDGLSRVNGMTRFINSFKLELETENHICRASEIPPICGCSRLAIEKAGFKGWTLRPQSKRKCKRPFANRPLCHAHTRRTHPPSLSLSLPPSLALSRPPSLPQPLLPPSPLQRIFMEVFLHALHMLRSRL